MTLFQKHFDALVGMVALLWAGLALHSATLSTLVSPVAASAFGLGALGRWYLDQRKAAELALVDKQGNLRHPRPKKAQLPPGAEIVEGGGRGTE
jgi:hypothetical protein